MADELYLSRLFLDLRSREVRRDLSDCNNMHRTIMSAFPDDLSAHDPSNGGTARAEAAALFRVDPGADGSVLLLVQSALAPDWSALPGGYLRARTPETKDISPLLGHLREGTPLRFRLLANPTRKVDTKTGPDGRKNNGRRVDLRGEEALSAWLARKGEQCGFRICGVRCAPLVPSVETAPQPGIHGNREGAMLTLRGVLFEGVLEIVSSEPFKAGLRAGIGPGKAYGFGLMSIAPANQDAD